MKLTEAEIAFLKSQKLTEDDVFDCHGRNMQQSKALARQYGKPVLLGEPCKTAGHRLRTRSGHCAQCDTSKLGFQQRHRTRGRVYLAYSANANLLKIGSTINLVARKAKLSFDAIGKARDWRFIFHVEVMDSGRLEQAAHVALSRYATAIPYNKDGAKQISRECFRCKPIVAANAIIEVAERDRYAVLHAWYDNEFDWRA